jgi:hypothetical protein
MMKRKIDEILWDIRNAEEEKKELLEELQESRFDFALSLVRNTHDWELVRYNPRCHHVVIGNNFSLVVPRLNCFTIKYIRR